MPTSWTTFGHDSTKRILERHLQTANFPHAYLFSGPSGIGKCALAKEFSAKILGTERLAIHVDFLALDQTEEISVEQVREFMSRLSLKPLSGAKKVALINNAELLNTQSGNALLKTLEEPSPSTVVILVGDGRRLLRTVWSRCLVLSLQPFSRRQLQNFAAVEHLAVGEEMVDLSFGSPAEFLALSRNPALVATRREQLQRWQQLKAAPSATRFLDINGLADLDTEELSRLLGLWLLDERQRLAARPGQFNILAALAAAVSALHSNQNKKSVLQSLMFSI